MRSAALPRRATRIPREGAGRAPNGTDVVAGCGVGVAVKRSAPRALGAHHANYPPRPESHDRTPALDRAVAPAARARVAGSAAGATRSWRTASRRSACSSSWLVVAGFFIHLPYVIISPGSATPLDAQVVQIEGAPTYPETSGNVLFLTVQVSTSEPNVWRIVAAWLDSDREVEDRSTVQGCLSDAENRQFNTDLMDQSQNDAKYVALTRLGYEVPANPVQVRVVEVCRGTPAAGTAADGRSGARSRRHRHHRRDAGGRSRAPAPSR